MATTTLETFSGHVTMVHRSLAERDASGYPPIIKETALRLLRNREEELRYAILFGNNPQKIVDVGRRLVPIFESAWKQRHSTPTLVELHDSPSLLRDFSVGCRGIIQLGNFGHFFDPNQTLVVALNKLVNWATKREQLITQCLALTLEP